MRKITNSEIMKRAWEVSREAASKFGGNVKQYFAMALKLTWEKAKRIMSKKVVIVPEWFIKKTTGIRLGQDHRTCVVIKETEKAVLVEILGSETWCPKSILA